MHEDSLKLLQQYSVLDADPAGMKEDTSHHRDTRKLRASAKSEPVRLVSSGRERLTNMGFKISGPAPAELSKMHFCTKTGRRPVPVPSSLPSEGVITVRHRSDQDWIANNTVVVFRPENLPIEQIDGAECFRGVRAVEPVEK